NVQATQLRALRVRDRIVSRGCARQAGDRCRLGERQLVERLAEVHLCRGRRAVRTLSKEDLVEIKSQDLRLGELVLDAEGQKDLFQLAVKAALRCKKHVARELHGDRATALARLAGEQVDERGPQQPGVIDAVML